VPTNRLTAPELGNLSPLVRTTAVEALGGGRYRLNVTSQPGQSIRGSNLLAQLQFGSDSNQTSAFLSLPLSNVVARQPDGTVVGTAFTRNGRVVMIGDQPLLELTRDAGAVMTLRLFARPGDAYHLEQAPEATGPWTGMDRLRFPAREQRRSLGAGAGGTVFLRLVSIDASTPFLEILASDGGGMDLALYAEKGSTFELQTSSALNLPWTTWHTQSMTNSFHELRLDFTPGSNQFLRARKR